MVFIHDFIVRKKKWLSEETFKNGAVLCQSIPGATTMQTATYVGLRTGGPIGALTALFAFGLPAFVLMVMLSAIYQRTQNLQQVISAFSGLHVIVTILMANATLNFSRSSIKN